jgi:transcriptional regulator with XRE-family HTH domain
LPTVDAASAIRDARRRARLSQRELAARARTSQTAISAYETGAKVPSLATLIRLVEATGSRLMVDPGQHDRGANADDEQIGRWLADVLSLADAMPFRRQGDLRYPRLPVR